VVNLLTLLAFVRSIPFESTSLSYWSPQIVALAVFGGGAIADK
jgi:hypothetical protein